VAFFTGAAATGAAATGAAAAAAFFVAGAATGAAATVSVFLATVLDDLAAELIIPEAEEVDEDILRRTYCYSELKNHFLFDYLHRAL
jgi:hypothetical protein